MRATVQPTASPATPGSTSPADEMAPRVLAASLDRLTAALPKAVDEAMRKTLPGDYTPEAAKAISDTMVGILTGRMCRVWPTICADNTPGHYDHFADHYVANKNGDRMIDVSFIQFSDEGGDGPATISIGGVGNQDYAPSEVREATDKIRRLLDEADEMADKVQRMQGTDVPTPSERAFTRARIAIDAAVEASADPKGTALGLRTYAAMTADELTNPAGGQR